VLLENLRAVKYFEWVGATFEEDYQAKYADRYAG
jgi:hypothetical protein